MELSQIQEGNYYGTVRIWDLSYHQTHFLLLLEGM